MRKTKRIGIVLCVIVLLGASYFLLPGFTRAEDVYLAEYETNGDTMTVQAGIAGSVGSLRRVKVQTWQDGTIDLAFYHAFGGLNGSVGARSMFTFALPENAQMIRLYRGNRCWEEVLDRDPETGQWKRNR